MVTYDPSVIQQHAQRLYDRARAIIIVYGVGFGLMGLFAGMLIEALTGDLGPGLVGVGGLLCAVLGAAYGQARGFELRLQAQLALCQAQIEVNGRPAARPVNAMPPQQVGPPQQHSPPQQS